jgi:hypothetical protein
MAAMKFSQMCLGVSVLCLTLVGQDTQEVAEPEYVNQYFEIGSNGKLNKLQQEDATRVTRKTGNPLSSEVTRYIVLNGEHSKKRFLAGTDFSFVVRATSREYDPSTWFLFFNLKIAKGKRETVLDRMTSKTNEPLYKDVAVPVDFTTYGEHSWKIKPKRPLTPGEYEMSTNGVLGVWSFGVDRETQ